MDLEIRGKSAIVCGSSRGLGKACALALAKEGVNIWLSARHQEALDEAASEIAQAELGLSNGARAGLTGFVSGIAREPAQYNVTINNLLPGFIATDRLRAVVNSRAEAAHTDPDEFSEAFFRKIPARRPGDPDEFGSVCAFLCSQQAAYLTAQNVLMDGGAYPGTF